MKSLDKLNNVERAKLLFELFPDSIKGFVEWAQIYLESGLTEESLANMAKTWNNGMISYEMWVDLLRGVKKVIDKYKPTLHKSKFHFSDQLFDGYLAFVSTTLLSVYTEKQNNKKFNQTINLLFT